MGVGCPDDGPGEGDTDGVGLGDAVGRGVAVAVGRGDGLTNASWFEFEVGDDVGASDPPGSTVHAVTTNTVARTIGAIDRAFIRSP